MPPDKPPLPYGLGRVFVRDDRDKNYPLSDLLPKPLPPKEPPDGTEPAPDVRHGPVVDQRPK